jgi:pyruvate ferredoxin oxidoreductase gamma subunit
MFETRLHGRGGQGVVTAAELFSIAAFDDGLHAQAFPSFGSERTGAPVMSFCRISDREIRTREPVNHPGAVLVIDPTLLHQVDVFAGLEPDAYVVINSTRSFAELDLEDLVSRSKPERLLTVPATDLAREYIGRPLPNIAVLGAVAALTQAVTLDSLVTAIRERFKGKVGEGNVKAATAAYELVTPASAQARKPEVVDA